MVYFIEHTLLILQHMKELAYYILIGKLIYLFEKNFLVNIKFVLYLKNELDWLKYEGKYFLETSNQNKIFHVFLNKFI